MNIPSYILRPTCAILTFSMTCFAVPVGPIMDSFRSKELPASDAKQSEPVVSRALTAKEMSELVGKTGKNPYAAGSAKFAPQYKGVDLFTGNFTTSATDMSFEGGYGVPVNVTRSYSANNADEGPLGEGWTLSVDLRSTAGGLLKSSGAPQRIVPVEMQERPRNQTRPSNDPRPDVPASTVDANLAAPVEAVIATTASGEEVTLQKDVDGILTPPSWDQNEYTNEYEEVTQAVSGQEMPNVYRVLKSQIVKTPEGTIYEYKKLGRYVYGVTPFDETMLTSLTTNHEPSNILKITKVTDRHGNETTYNYTISSWAEPTFTASSGVPALATGSQANYAVFKKSNGYVVEAKLTQINMQPDRSITFEWGTLGQPIDRISVVKDKDTGTGLSERTVKYGYNSNKYLTQFTSAAGYVSDYGYSNGLLTTLTDTRGMTTTISYNQSQEYYPPLNETGPAVESILSPQGNRTDFWYDSGACAVAERLGNGIADGSTLHSLSAGFSVSSGLITVMIQNYANPGGLVESELVYDADTQNQVFTTSVSKTLYDDHNTGYSGYEVLDRGWQFNEFGYLLYQTTESTYNYFGNPLKKENKEWNVPYNSSTPVCTRTSTVEYSYWGADKYFQQKGVKSVDANRYSFTDYYTKNAATGKKGQVRAVYSHGLDSTHSNNLETVSSWIDDSSQYNVSTISEDKRWRYQHPVLQQESNQSPITPSSVSTSLPIPSAMFNYDSKGRATEVYKLSKFNSCNVPQYVKTESYYDNASYNTHGVAWRVIEAAGTASERVTETQAIDLAGRATQVVNANGNVFQTAYDADGRTLTVDCQNTGETLSWTTYGDATPRTVTSGVPIAVGNETIFSIVSYGTTANTGSYGQITNIVKDWAVAYSTEYEYDALGNRTQMTFTPSGGTGVEQVIRYSDYVSVGNALSPSYAYQTMTRMVLDSNGNPKYTPEEFHYNYDTRGRILEVAFAQTPNSQYANLDNGNDNQSSSWYIDHNGVIQLAQSRARTIYTYDDGGRLATLQTVWDTLGTNSYSSTPIRTANYTYETTGLDRGLKTSYKLYNGTNSTAVVDETYSYDSKLDYLTSATYADQTSANGTWTYDASGNRANSGYVYDELNRMTASAGGTTYANDAVGNRTQTNLPNNIDYTYTWNSQNQLIGTQCDNENPWSAQYGYQPDGLRCSKAIDYDSDEFRSEEGFLGIDVYENDSNTSYYYDGQMGIAEQYQYSPDGSYTATDWSQNIPGPRGIEMQRTKIYNASWQEQYPLYDGHGNMISALKITRPPLTLNTLNQYVYAGTTTSTVGGDRKYDVWGAVRGNNKTGYSYNRYCANLGHVADDDTGLIYMRARYYEPGTGRFISEDPARDGWNWYSFCANDPVQNVDESGKSWRRNTCGNLTSLSYLAVLCASALWLTPDASRVTRAVAIGLIESAIAFQAIALCVTDIGMGLSNTDQLLAGIAEAMICITGVIAAVCEAAELGCKNGFTAVVTIMLTINAVALLAACTVALMDPNGFSEPWN